MAGLSRGTGHESTCEASAAGAELPDERQEGTEPPTEPSIRLQRYLESFGRTGARLLRHAERGDADAAYRLGVLLFCERRPREAGEWLQLARVGGYDIPPIDRLSLDSAADAAFEIGTDYEAVRQPHAALVFFRRAGECGNAEAAYRVGLHYAQKNDHWDAATWFSRAAMVGHPHARREFAVAYRELSFSGVVLPSPDGAYFASRGGSYAPNDPFSLDGPGVLVGLESTLDPLGLPMESSHDSPVYGMADPLGPPAHRDTVRLPTVDELLQQIQRDRQGEYGDRYPDAGDGRP
ncbi:hypothetical protein GCM10010191_59360 [Actinomadura vinacea]|uniref:Sel1 repeat family protein n=1 Tax=Actinomadura vinacea TaxID=115336 RepID=A0ABN3JPR8_9ACTN